MSAPVIPGFAFIEHLGSGGFADVFLYEQQWPRQRVAVKVVRPDVPLTDREKYLFTGDHLAWSPSRGHLYAFRSACWYSWSEQIRSMERLLDYRFEWVLPGHGRPVYLPPGEMERSLRTCIRWMRER